MRWMALTSLAMATSASAMDAPAPAPAEDWQQAIKDLARENAELRQRVSELEQKDGDTWLTEQRANQIRALVEDVLADADARSSLLRAGASAGWDNGFYISSADGNYTLAIDGQLQVRWVDSYHNEADHNRGGFENTRTKLTFRGHIVNDAFSYLVRAGFERRDFNSSGDDFVPSPINGGDFNLQDAWIRWDLNNQWNFRVGQFKLPFNREELVSSQYQLLVERSLVNQNLNIGRSQGFQLEFITQDIRAALMYSDGGHDQAGGDVDVDLTSTPIPENLNALAQDTEYAVTGRFEWKGAGTWKQFEDFTSFPTEQFGFLIGAAIHSQRNESDGAFSVNSNEVPWIGATIDASFEFGGANLFGSFTHHYLDRSGGTDFRIYGVTIQGGVFVLPKWEVFARYEYGWWQFQNDDNFPSISVATLGANYYIQGHDLKFTMDIGVAFDQVTFLWDSDIAGYRDEGPTGSNQTVMRLQLQLLF